MSPTQFTPDELRLIAHAAPQMIRMLRAREERVIQRMYGEFRAGKENQLSALAELACVRDQIAEIQSVLRQNEAQRSE